MKSMLLQCFFAVSLAFACFISNIACAYAYDSDAHMPVRPLPELRAGMYSYDVIQHWGPAREKIEYETKRQERWEYGKAHVIFQQSRVRAWNTGANIFAAVLVTAQPGKKVRPLIDGSSPQTRNLLSDILREIPSGSPDPASSTTIGAVGGAEIRPVQPSTGMVPPEPMIE